jgi:hypothetical protein
MRKLIFLFLIVSQTLNALCQQNSSFTFMPYFRGGYLAAKPTRADANIYTITSDDVTYKGAVLGGGCEFMYDFNKVSPGIDLGYSSVFKNSYEDYDGTRTGNNTMNELFIFSFVDLTIAKNLDVKFGVGGHYTFINWELTEDYGTVYYSDGSETSFYFGLLAAIEKSIPVGDQGEISISAKINPLFSPTEYDWGFLMPLTLNLGYRFRI